MEEQFDVQEQFYVDEQCYVEEQFDVDEQFCVEEQFYVEEQFMYSRVRALCCSDNWVTMESIQNAIWCTELIHKW